MTPTSPVDPESTPEPTPEPTAEPTRHARSPRRSRWRAGTPVVLLLSGALMVVSATNSEGTDLRPGRYTDLTTLTQGEADEAERLLDQVAALRAEVGTLGDAVADREVQQERRRADRLRAAAGLEPVSGEGVTIVLSDASTEQLEAAIADPDVGSAELNRLLVHQQDIQAVVNALWAGGAQAVTIQGQRVVSTTGIKCSGSAVTLQGVPYPQPYVIQAVGDPAALFGAVEGDSDVTGYRADAQDPAIGVGYEASSEADVVAPAFDGVVDMESADPVTG